MIPDNHKNHMCDDFEPGMYQNEISTEHMNMGKTDDSKQIAALYRNKAIFLLTFTINIT